MIFSPRHGMMNPVSAGNPPEFLKSETSRSSMKLRRTRCLLSAASALLLAPAAFAQDQNGTWNTTTSLQSWATAGNWTDSKIANGSGFTADFSTLNLTADTTVNLDGARTIGNLIFGDTDTSSAGSWTLAAGSGGPLTLAGTSPTITVNTLGAGKSAAIGAVLAGSDGFTKDGAGTLRLTNGTNTISGPIVVSAGTLTIAAKALSSATTVAINGGTLVSATGTPDAIGGTISFGGGTLQYNNDPGTDYSAQFSTADNQQYRINVISSGTPSTPRIATFSSNLSSAGGTLLKSGTGTLILNAANTFSGTTTVSAGTLQLDNALALQNSAIDTTASITGTGAAGIILNGVTTPTFGGLTGNKNLSTLFNTSTGGYSSVTNVTLNPGSGADHSYTGVIADGATGMTLTKTGAGRQVLGNANTYTGGTILNGGTLNYSNAAALSTGSISFTGGTILQAGVATTLANPVSVAGSITGTVGTAGFATTLSGAITGSGTLAKGGGGVLTLTGGLANTIGGGFRVTTGRLEVLDGLSLTNAGPVTVLSGGSLNYSKNFGNGNDLANNLTLSGTGDGTFGALNLRGNATATGTITLAADATISHDFNTATISGSITGTDRNLTLTTLSAGQPGMTVSGPISLGTGSLTVNGVANSGNFSIKLSGDNSYSGGTTVTAGTLLVTNSTGSGTGSGTVTVNSGAILGGTGTIGGNIAATGSISPGEGGIGTLKAGGEVTWNSGNNWQFNLSSTGNSSDKLEITGALTKGSGSSFIFDFMGSTPDFGKTFTLATFASTTFTLSDFNLASSLATLGSGAYAGSSFSLSSTSLQFTTIPEPTSALAALLLSAGLFRRRRA
jgi:autotransporter-associated beta strand protein